MGPTVRACALPLTIFQLPMLWLNASALSNIEAIVETDATFNLPRSALKTEAPLNIFLSTCRRKFPR